MKSSYHITDNICTITLSLDDISSNRFGSEMLHIIKKNKISDVVVNMDRFEVITSPIIKSIEKFVNILKLNNIKTIICGFSVESASIIFHFVDEVNFDTALNVQSALDVIKNK